MLTCTGNPQLKTKSEELEGGGMSQTQLKKREEKKIRKGYSRVRLKLPKQGKL